MTHDNRTTAEILAADPDTIVLDACPPHEATISLAGIVGQPIARRLNGMVVPPLARYREVAARGGFRGCDELTQAVVHAIAGGFEIPDEFSILDTYYDIGAPEVEDRCERIRREVHAIAAAAGIPMRETFTMLDGRA